MILGLAIVGIMLLALGAFVRDFEAFEVPLTVFGSLCLAAAHLWNWRQKAA